MPEQTTMIENARTPVRELRAGEHVDAVLLVRERDVRQKKDGSDYFALRVSDRTGETWVKIWSDSAGYKLALDGEFQVGQPVRARGRYMVDDKWGAEIELKGDGAGIRPAQPDEIVWDEILDGPERSVEELEAKLNELVKTLGEPGDPLHDLVVKVLADCWDDFRMAPAAKSHHQPYRHGLLEHTLNVAQSVSAIASVYPDADRDVAVAGAILHDVGKVDFYTLDPLQRDVSSAGHLYGEITQSYYRVRRVAEREWGPPEDWSTAIAAAVHIVASHHGEHGATAPSTREAFLVHYVDMIDSRMGGIERVEKRAQPNEEWSGFDRGINGRVWLRPEPAAPEVTE